MPKTFEELISAGLDDLYSAALVFSQDEHRAEELLQEAAIQAFHRFGSDVDRSDFRGWILGILVSVYMRRERSRGRDLFAESAPSIHLDAGSADPVPLPERGTRAYDWLKSWLRDAWPELDGGDRIVLWLATVERMRRGQIARILGIDEEQVRRRHYRARRTLSVGASRQLATGSRGRAEA